MTPEKARQVLHLPYANLDAKDIKLAFRDMVALLSAYGNPPENINEIQQARDVLLSEVETAKSACKLCGGTGKVRSVMGWRSCSACGDRR